MVAASVRDVVWHELLRPSTTSSRHLPAQLTPAYTRTHDSMNARKAHNTGRNHIANVRDYFANLGRDGTQNHIDQIVNSHEGGGRAQMFAAPSMRLGAGFMNPMATAPQGGGYS